MRGSQAFISQLYKEQYEKLFHAAFYMIGEAELAKDIVQDTFVTAISHLPDLLAHPKPEAWLMLTLRNLVRNEQRRSVHKTIPLQTVFNEPAATLPPPTIKITVKGTAASRVFCRLKAEAVEWESNGLTL